MDTGLPLSLPLKMKVVALAQAWELGALAGWMWSKLPQTLNNPYSKIDAQYKM